MQVILFPFSSNSQIFTKSKPPYPHHLFYFKFTFNFNLISIFSKLVFFTSPFGYVAITVQISISRTNFLNYGRSMYALPNFRLTTDPITSMWPSQPQAVNFFICYYCVTFFVAFILTMLNFHFINYIFVCVVLFLLTNPLFLWKPTSRLNSGL